MKKIKNLIIEQKEENQKSNLLSLQKNITFSFIKREILLLKLYSEIDQLEKKKAILEKKYTVGWVKLFDRILGLEDDGIQKEGEIDHDRLAIESFEEIKAQEAAGKKRFPKIAKTDENGVWKYSARIGDKDVYRNIDKYTRRLKKNEDLYCSRQEQIKVLKEKKAQKEKKHEDAMEKLNKKIVKKRIQCVEL